MFLINCFGLAFVVFSLAEMSSIAPTAGGQYHWASEFAAPSMQKLASYVAGWLSCITWTAGFAGASFIIGSTFEGLIVANRPKYVPQTWHAYLFVVLVVSFCLLVNTLLARFLPRIEGFVFIAFVSAFIAIMVVLWVMAPRLSTAEVFSTIQAGSGWDSLGLSMLSGQSAIMFLIVGSDATAHMAEETRNAAVVVPKAMIASYFVNAGLTFVMLVTYCFLLIDYDDVLASPLGTFGQPSIQVFINAIGSVGGGSVLVAIPYLIGICGLCNWMASDARQVFAFARDHGLPFGDWIAKVNAEGTYPVNSLLVIFAGGLLLPLITLGSTVAFNALTSLQMLALMLTYLISLSCVLWRRLFGEPLPPSPWTLGRTAIPINVMGVIYCLYQVIFLPWPVVLPVTAANFNWASVMFGGVMVLVAAYYLVWGRKAYQGPVVYLRSRQARNIGRDV